jgi:hypothetical protein
MKSPFARQLRLAAIFSASLLGSIQSSAQSTSYSSVEAIGDTPLQLGYYASANKNCTPAALPTLRVTQAPKHGTLTAKRGVLATSKIAGCPDLKIPAQVIFYQSRQEYVGPDHLVGTSKNICLRRDEWRSRWAQPGCSTLPLREAA